MATIRKGQMKDCKHLLTVYQGTHWDAGYTTLEQVKNIHRLVGFQKWGWLIAEKDVVIGEILFRIEKNPIAKKIGIIDDIGVDVRFQKKLGIGRLLVSAAEDEMRKKGISRVFVTTPPEAYNFWMKVKYFARGSLQLLKIKPKALPVKSTRNISTQQISSDEKIPKSFFVNHKAHPGRMVHVLRTLVDEGKQGRIFEFLEDDKVIGMGAIVKHDDGKAEFVADVSKKGVEHLPIAISRTAKAATKLKATTVFTIIPSDLQETYLELAKWSVERYRDIPVTKLI